jgi:hypothetical protein
VSPQNKPREPAQLVERVKAILASKKLTLHQVSQTTETLYGKSSPFFLPHNFYYDLGLDTFTPSLHQLFALSRISDYRLTDWMRVFGFDLSDVTRLQVLLPSNRTTLLDHALDDPNSWVVWFRSKRGTIPFPDVVPLGKLLEYSPPRRVASLSNIDSHNFLYAKLGRQDDFAFPDLLPGSIVRVNRRVIPSAAFWSSGKISDHFFLIEHGKGFCCCRIQPIGKDRIIPISTQLAYAQVELRIPGEARIMGAVDWEIRPLLRPEQPEVPHDLTRHWRPEALHNSDMKLGQLLRHARTRKALSFRDASALTREIAKAQGDQQYFASPGSLSDYEALDMPPRHIHKAITLCTIYGLEWSAFLSSVGLQMNELGTDFIADELLFRLPPAKTATKEDAGKTEGEFFTELLRHWEGEIPLFLRGSLSGLSSIPNLSLHDVFWIGEEQGPLHPNLNGGYMAIVNRRKKRPLHWKSKPLWQQPVYVVLKRDGTYLCACCGLENGTLVLHSYPQGYRRSERLQNQHDAEVIGQIVTLARKLT